MGSAFFEDTPAWEAGLRVQEAENKWLLREMLAVLGASKSYARSLTNAGPFGASAFAGGDLGLGEGIGGMLGALAGAGAGALAAGMEGMGLVDDDDPGRRAYPTSSSAEANFAAALERIGTVAASTAEEEEMAAPMAAAIGAPLLHPIADALRAVGMLRESLGRRVTDKLVRNVQAFVDEDLGAVSAARERWVADRTACERARAQYLSQSASRPAAQAQAAKDLAAAKEVPRGVSSEVDPRADCARGETTIRAPRVDPRDGARAAKILRRRRRRVARGGPRPRRDGRVRDGQSRAGGDANGTVGEDPPGGV